jgi:CRISPR-associated endonuclease Csn1
VQTGEFEKEPLYRLWYVIYSIPEVEDTEKTLIKKFGIDQDIAKKNP